MAFFPIRCFTCGKILNCKNNVFEFFRLKEEFNQKEALDRLEIRKSCCRRMFLSYDDNLEEKLLMYPRHYQDQNLIRKVPVFPKLRDIDKS